MTNIGFRILPFPKRPSPKLLAELRKIVTAHLSDNMNRLYAVAAEIRPYHRRGKLVGPALTVKVPPGDNLMVHKAIDIAPDIIKLAREQAVKETAVLKAIRQGKLDRAWVDRTLRQLGCDV